MISDELEIAEALARIARALDRLGNADAATPMGGLEAHGKATQEGLEEIASAISGGLTEIAEGLHAVAEALEQGKGI